MRNNSDAIPSSGVADVTASSQHETVSQIHNHGADSALAASTGGPTVEREKSPPNSMVSSWIVGRKLSRLNWDLQLGLLNRSGSFETYSETSPVSYFNRSIEEIALATRGMVELTLAKDKIEKDLRQEWNSYSQGLVEAAAMGAYHVFDLFKANLSLISIKRESWDFERESSDLQPEHDDWCHELVSPGMELVDRMLKVIEANIGEFEIQALHLGKHVDHGVHPLEAYRLTYEEPVDWENPRIDLEDPPKGSWWLATRIPIPGEHIPQWEWFAQLEYRWRELGLDEPLPEELLRIAKCATDRAKIADFMSLIASIDRAAVAGLDRLDWHVVPTLDSKPTELLVEASSTGEPGYLGLILFKDECVVGRAGYESKIDLRNSLLSWKIILKLINNYQNICNHVEIKRCWAEAGRYDTPSPGAVQEAIRPCGQKLGISGKHGNRFRGFAPTST